MRECAVTSMIGVTGNKWRERHRQTDRQTANVLYRPLCAFCCSECCELITVNSWQEPRINFLYSVCLGSAWPTKPLTTQGLLGHHLRHWAVAWLRRLVDGLSPRRTGFDLGSVHVGFVVDKVALGQVFPPSACLVVLFYLPVSRFSPSTSVLWLRRLVDGLSLRRPGFDLGSVHVGFVVDKVALWQVFPRVLRFSPVNCIPPVLHYLEKWKKLSLYVITGLHNKS